MNCDRNFMFACTLSIVIPQYNGAAMLRDCIASLYRAADFLKMREPAATSELIVVDNASTDETADFLTELSRSDSPALSIEVVSNTENYGFAKAVNQGIRRAKGEYIVLLNNDTIAEDAFLFALLQCIRQDERIFSASAMMRMYHEPDLIDDAGDIYCLMGWALQRGHGKPVHRYETPCRIFSSCGGAAIYRRSILEEIGLLDDRFFAYMEDVDLGYRSLIYGYRNVYCPDARVLHIGSASSGGHVSAFKVRLSSRNSIYVIYKNMPLFFLLLHLPLLLIGFVIRYLYFTKDGYREAFEEGYREAFATLSQVEKVAFRLSHLPNYLYLEAVLLLNTFKAFVWKLQRAAAKIKKS